MSNETADVDVFFNFVQTRDENGSLVKVINFPTFLLISFNSFDVYFVCPHSESDEIGPYYEIASNHISNITFAVSDRPRLFGVTYSVTHKGQEGLQMVPAFVPFIRLSWVVKEQ